jgi:FKBP-type peptidyl-prolyl cis-trans isomerase FkpA/FKBP-type peptidyl-prolyl cis-trans isomerase FklB
MKWFLTLAAPLALALAAPALAADPAAMTEEQKVVYALGVNIGQSLQSYALSPAELELLRTGMADGLGAAPAKVDPLAYRVKIQQLAQSRAAKVAEAEKAVAAGFLEKLAHEPKAEKTASGLVYIPLVAGTGASPKATDTVRVHYHGTLRDGSVFDSSVERKQPATFPLNRVVPCWTEGLQKMKVGGKAKLTCPSAIAYGDRGRPPKIKPGAALQFEVELLEIVPQGARPPMQPMVLPTPGGAGPK